MGGDNDDDNAFKLFGQDGYPDAHLNDAVSDLQNKLDNECSKRREERFIWICALIIVFDVYAYSQMETWAGPVFCGIIEIIFLIIAGQYFGIDHIYTLVTRLIEKWNGRIGKQ